MIQPPTHSETLARLGGDGTPGELRGATRGSHASSALTPPSPLSLRAAADMLMGLKEGQEKMSKSDPDSAIFMEDSVDDVRRKIKRAFCPPEVAGNPCLNWIRHIVFGRLSGGWTLSRSPENGGPVTYATYAALEADYASGALHPGDLKANLAETLNGFLEPVRAHFASGEPKRLLEQVMKFRVTR